MTHSLPVEVKVGYIPVLRIFLKDGKSCIWHRNSEQPLAQLISGDVSVNPSFVLHLL